MTKYYPVNEFGLISVPYGVDPAAAPVAATEVAVTKRSGQVTVSIKSIPTNADLMDIVSSGDRRRKIFPAQVKGTQVALSEFFASAPGTARFAVRWRVDGVWSKPLVLDVPEADDPVSPPALTGTATIVGDPKIGQSIVLDTDVFSNMENDVPTVVVKMDGVEVSTDPSYVPLPAHNGLTMTAVITATNAAGTVSTTTAGKVVTYVEPGLSGNDIANATLTQGSAAIEFDASTLFILLDDNGEPITDGFTYSVTGTEATIDSVTGLGTVTTSSLRTDDEVEITATNSGGSAVYSFFVTIQAVPENPFPGVLDPSLYDLYEIRDTEPAGNRGATLGDYTEQEGFTLTWYAGENPAGHPTQYGTVTPNASFATTIPKNVGVVQHMMLRWRNANGDFALASEVISITLQGLYTEPVLDSALPDVNATQGDADIVVDVSSYFSSLNGATFSVTGAGASITTAGELTLSCDALAAGITIEVTATNVGGATPAPFTFTVIAVDTGYAEFPTTLLANNLWTDGEERDLAPEGRFKCTLNAAAPTYEGFTWVWSPTANPNGIPQYGQDMVPNQSYTTRSTSARGTVIYTMWFLRRDEDGAFQLQSAKRTYTVQGLTLPPTPTGLPVVNSTATNIAVGLSLFQTTHSGSYAGNRGPANAGPQTTVLGVRRMATSDSAAESRLLAQVRQSITGNKGPLILTGYTAQHDMNHLAAFVFARLIPSVWNDLTSTEKNKVTTLVTAMCAGACFACADKQTNASHYDVYGYSKYAKNWAPNFRLAMVGTLMLAIPFFGTPDDLEAEMNDYSHTAMRSALSNYGLSNAQLSFSGNHSNAVSVSTMNNFTADFRYNSLRLRNVFDICDLEHRNMWGKPFQHGYSGPENNNGYGVFDVYANELRACLATTSARNNYPGNLLSTAIQAMANELRAKNGKGSGQTNNLARSAMSYAINGVGVEQMYICALIAAGLLNRDTPGINSRIGGRTGQSQYSWIERLELGWQDLNYKTVNTYRSFSKNGRKASNNEDWSQSFADNNYYIKLRQNLYTSFILPALT